MVLESIRSISPGIEGSFGINRVGCDLFVIASENGKDFRLLISLYTIHTLLIGISRIIHSAAISWGIVLGLTTWIALDIEVFLE